MRRKVATRLALVGTASLLVVGLLGNPVRAADGQASGRLTIRFSEVPPDLDSPAKSADNAPREIAVTKDAKALSERRAPAVKESSGAAPTPNPNSPIGMSEVSSFDGKDSTSQAKAPASTSVDNKRVEAKKDTPVKIDPAKADAIKADAAKSAPQAIPGVAKPTPLAPPPAMLPLSPQMVALRDRVRAVTAQHFHEPLNTNDNVPSQILKFCLAYGCDTEIRYGSSAGNAMSGIGALCYGYPCAGYRLLVVDDRKVFARLGYGLQETPGELLAVLAQSAVPVTYEIRAEPWRGTVANLVESEKLSCLPGGDLSQKLIGLSHYLPDGATWKNARGDEWSLERIVREELNRSPATDSADATNHLTALAYALERHTRAKQLAEGQYERAQKYLAEYQTFAFSVQNADGSWNPAFFAAKGASRDVAGTLRATGRILEWLVASLPVERLHDRQIVLSLGFVTGVLESYYAQASLVSTSTREIDGVMHALHSLRIYDRRVFKPAEPHSIQRPDTLPTEASRERSASG